MKRATVIVLVVIVSAVLSVQAQTQYRFPRPIGDDGGRGEPPPVDPVPVLTASPIEFQLIGFSAKAVDGNHGVLNMTRACHGSFPGSRMCTVEEIDRTVNVPDPPHLGHAWIQIGSTPQRGRIDDCAGWRSNSAKDKAVTIELGSESGCYGGYVTRSCNELLSVACCAPIVERS